MLNHAYLVFILAQRIAAAAVLLCLSLIGLTFGCSKQEETAPPPAPQQAAPPASPTAPSANPPAPAATIPTATDPNAAISQAENALKAKQYEQAAQALLSIQSRTLTEQQSQAAHHQMVRLQTDLAAAVARGDAQAKAAAELLRRSASGGH